jgi:hypothetical protein
MDWSKEKVLKREDADKLAGPNIVVPDFYTGIGYHAFADRIDIVSVRIPHGVKIICSHAFAACESLEEINIPQGVVIIGDLAFSGCEKLENVSVPESVAYTGLFAFNAKAWQDKQLEYESVIYNEHAGWDVIIRSEPEEYSSFMKFMRDAAPFPEKHTKPAARPSRPERIFTRESLYKLSGKHIVIPEGYTAIEAEALVFRKEHALSVTLPASVTGIIDSSQDYVLRDWVMLSRSMEIEDSIENIHIDPANPKYSSIDGVVFSKDKTILYEYPAGKRAKSYTIPDGVREISDMAFCGGWNLEVITVPDTVEHICLNGCRRPFPDFGPRIIRCRKNSAVHKLFERDIYGMHSRWLRLELIPEAAKA